MEIRNGLLLSGVAVAAALLILIARFGSDATSATFSSTCEKTGDESLPALGPTGLPIPAAKSTERALASGTTRSAFPSIDDGDPKSGPLLLRVTDADGEPLAGARVCSFADDHAEYFAGEFETDADGLCRLPVPASVDRFALVVEKEGYFPFHGRRFRENDSPMRMLRSVTLHGFALEHETGKGVPFATIHYRRPDCDAFELRRIVADDLGAYVVAGARTGREETFELHAEGFAAQVVSFKIRDEGERLRHDFLFQRGHRLAGEVVDLTRGTSVPGAELGSWHFRIRTDDSGRFDVRVLPHPVPDLLLFDVLAEGYCKLNAVVAIEQLAEEPFLSLRLPRCVRVKGIVLDSDGTSIGGAEVRLGYHGKGVGLGTGDASASLSAALPEGWSYEEDFRLHSKSDEQGRYEIGGLVPGRRGRYLVVEHEKYETEIIDLPPSEEPGTIHLVDVVLTPVDPKSTGAITGRFTVDDHPADGGVGWEGATGRGWAAVDSDGCYSLENVEAGEIELQAWVGHVYWNARACEGASVRLMVEAGCVLTHDFDLHPVLEELSGRIMYADGRPASGIDVHVAVSELDYEISMESGPDGAYSFELLDAGRTWEVTVYYLDEVRFRRGIELGATDIDFIVPAMGTLRLRVRDADTGLPVPRFILGWKRSGEVGFGKTDLFPWDPADLEGWYELRLPAGRIDLIVRSDFLGYLPRIEAGIDLPSSGDGPRVDMRLEQGLIVDLVLPPGQEPPFEEHFVLLLHESEWGEIRFLRDADGDLETVETPSFPGASWWARRLHFQGSRTATLRGLAPGLHRFKVFPEDIELLPAEVLIGEDSSAPIAIDWRWR